MCKKHGHPLVKHISGINLTGLSEELNMLVVRHHLPGSQKDGFPRKKFEDTNAEEWLILRRGNGWDLALLQGAGLEEEKHVTERKLKFSLPVLLFFLMWPVFCVFAMLFFLKHCGRFLTQHPWQWLSYREPQEYSFCFATFPVHQQQPGRSKRQAGNPGEVSFFLLLSHHCIWNKSRIQARIFDTSVCKLEYQTRTKSSSVC